VLNPSGWRYSNVPNPLRSERIGYERYLHLRELLMDDMCRATRAAKNRYLRVEL